jgi:hypothetical protein
MSPRPWVSRAKCGGASAPSAPRRRSSVAAGCPGQRPAQAGAGVGAQRWTRGRTPGRCQARTQLGRRVRWAERSSRRARGGSAAGQHPCAPAPHRAATCARLWCAPRARCRPPSRQPRGAGEEGRGREGAGAAEPGGARQGAHWRGADHERLTLLSRGTDRGASRVSSGGSEAGSGAEAAGARGASPHASFDARRAQSLRRAEEAARRESSHARAAPGGGAAIVVVPRAPAEEAVIGAIRDERRVDPETLNKARPLPLPRTPPPCACGARGVGQLAPGG